LHAASARGRVRRDSAADGPRDDATAARRGGRAKTTPAAGATDSLRAMRGPAFATVLALVAASAATSLLADDAPTLPNWKKGEQEGTVQIDGQTEKFVALVPEGYSPKKPVAAVLLLHGNGEHAPDFLKMEKPFVGKTPPLLVALERCDNTQKAEGYAAKYLDELKKQFAIADGKVFAIGFSGGGFRLWDDVICKADVAQKFRGVVCVGSAWQNFAPPDKPTPAPTVILVGDPKDSNFKDAGPKGEKALADKGYEVIVLEHSAGHSTPAPEMKDVFAWIEAVSTGKKTTLATRRVDDKAPKDGKKH